MPTIPFSLLDLAPVCEGSTPTQAFANALDLARHAEALGYRRYWLAEHHNMPGIASAAPRSNWPQRRAAHRAFAVGVVAVMAHHARCRCRAFGTLAALYPWR